MKVNAHYEARGKSHYRTEGIKQITSVLVTSHQLGPHSIFTHGRIAGDGRAKCMAKRIKYAGQGEGVASC